MRQTVLLVVRNNYPGPRTGGTHDGVGTWSSLPPILATLGSGGRHCAGVEVVGLKLIRKVRQPKPGVSAPLPRELVVRPAPGLPN
jgi:hypothetical protein